MKGKPTIRVGDVVTIRKTVKEIGPADFHRSVNSLLDHGWQLVSVNRAVTRRQRLTAWVRKVARRG